MNYQRSRGPLPRAFPQQTREQVPAEPCGTRTSDTPSPAMVYPIPSAFGNLFTPDQALKNGTLFRTLLMPFSPAGGKGCGCNP